MGVKSIGNSPFFVRFYCSDAITSNKSNSTKRVAFLFQTGRQTVSWNFEKINPDLFEAIASGRFYNKITTWVSAEFPS